MNVIITGAGKGLALELVKLHVQKGDFVYALSHSATEELCSIAQNNDCVRIDTVELENEYEIAKVLESIESKSIDAIYNVAGIWYEDQMVGSQATDIDKVLKMYKVNSIAPLCIMKYGKRLLKNNGIVVNVSSEAGSIGMCHRDNDYGYCMSKAALNMASMIFRNEMSEEGIRVYCYHPGWLRTQMGGERAAASKESISARESAEKLYSYIYENENSINGMFFDYTNKEWSW